jgi:predicted RNA-binding protein with PUA-like domain
MLALVMSSYFLVKSEPFKYPFASLLKDKRTTWDGVRNFEARNHLRSMKLGDLLLFYHSSEGKEIVGIAKVLRAGYPDPTAEEGEWTAVDIGPVKALAVPVSLATIKDDPKLGDMLLIKRSRLSVVPVTAAEWKRVLELGKTKL